MAAINQSRGSALQLDFGKFYTSAGGEVPDILGNLNYSRLLLFVLGAPYDHFGFRASIPVTRTFTAGVQIVNGWNNVRDNNTGKTAALTSTLAEAKWSWSQTYIVGTEKTDTNLSLIESCVGIEVGFRIILYWTTLCQGRLIGHEDN
jgi:hypothetical protein